MTAKHDRDILIINGRRYSARTGKPLDHHSASLDGVAPAGSKPKHHVAATIHHSAKAKHDPTHNTSVDGVSGHRKPAGKTVPAAALHRRTNTSGRHKPGEHTRQQKIKVQSAAHHSPAAVKSSGHSQPANLQQAAKLTSERAERSRLVKRSAKISKFGTARNTTKHASVAPVEIPLPQNQPQVDAEPTNTSLPAHQPPVLDPQAGLLTKLAQHEDAKVHAVNHHSTNKRKKKLLKKPRLASSLATVAAVLVISGYIAYLNIPNLALRVAASRAGMSAEIPSWRPDGFKFAGPVAYSPGSIIIGFQSTTGDNREYKLAQRLSPWDSQSLLENYVSRQTDQPAIFQERGLTIYVWNGSNAAWVDQGVWYTIEGDSFLNPDQLLRIAASI